MSWECMETMKWHSYFALQRHNSALNCALKLCFLSFMSLFDVGSLSFVQHEYLKTSQLTSICLLLVCRMWNPIYQLCSFKFSRPWPPTCTISHPPGSIRLNKFLFHQTIKQRFLSCSTPHLSKTIYISRFPIEHLPCALFIKHWIRLTSLSLYYNQF